MNVRGILRGLGTDTQGLPTATVQLIGVGNLAAYASGLSVSAAIPVGDLALGALVECEIPDRYSPSDGHVTAIAVVASSSTNASGGAAVTTQSGQVTVSLNGAGAGTAAVSFSPAFGSAPQVTTSVYAGYGHVSPTGVTVSGFTASVTGGPANKGVVVSWSATG